MKRTWWSGASCSNRACGPADLLGYNAEEIELTRIRFYLGRMGARLFVSDDVVICVAAGDDGLFQRSQPINHANGVRTKAG